MLKWALVHLLTYLDAHLESSLKRKNPYRPFTIMPVTVTVSDAQSSSSLSRKEVDRPIDEVRSRPPTAATSTGSPQPRTSSTQNRSPSAISSPVPRTISISSAQSLYVPSAPSYPYIGPSDRIYKVFLFVNPTSGGNAAAAFTKAGLKHAILTDPNVELFISDIREGPSGNKPAFLQLREVVKTIGQGELCYAVMAGGDGTVLWGISEIWEHNIDESKIAIGVIPYGTGNDFARALSWQSLNAINPFGEDMQKLKNLCNEWFSAPVIKQDLWDLTLEVHPGGEFKQIDSKTRKKKILEGPDAVPMTRLNKKVCNYFSIGIESRIGIGFDRHRKQSQVRNKIVYLNEGIKKNFFHHKICVNRIVSRMLDLSENEDQPVIVFETSGDVPRKLQKCGSLIAVNIPSFASGLDIWSRAGRLGLSGPGTDKALDLQELMKAPQLMGDGKIEWVSFSGVTSIGAEQIMEGHGRRIHQGKGPFEIEFNPDLDPDERVYFQIDGEYYQMTRPKVLRFKHFRTVQCLANRAAKKKCYRASSLTK